MKQYSILRHVWSQIKVVCIYTVCILNMTNQEIIIYGLNNKINRSLPQKEKKTSKNKHAIVQSLNDFLKTSIKKKPHC